MHLRPMQRSDLPEIADLSAETMLDDEVVICVAPGRHKYYTSFRNGFLRRTYARSLRRGWFIWVAETDEGDEPTAAQKERREEERGGRVVGYAAWLRAGDSPVAKRWQSMNGEWFTKVESYLVQLKNQYWTLLHLDWSEDCSKRAFLVDCFEQTFDKRVFPEAWHLENAVVHTEYQRRGIGTRLVKWGIDQAEAERVPCGVESSFAGLRLYENMGFRKFGEMRFGQKDEEMMAVLVWEPSGMKDHWFVRAKAELDAERKEQTIQSGTT